MALGVGDVAPDFDLPSTLGENVSLSQLRGKKVVLYFYPKDSTPGCTTEACDFRDRHGAIEAENTVVLGVSKDSIQSHQKFRSAQGLPFPLLTDAGNEVAQAYGAYGEKKLYGKPVTGTIRSTFLIDEEGKVAKVWSPVKVAGHADEVLAAIGAPVPAIPPAGMATGALVAAGTATAEPKPRKVPGKAAAGATRTRKAGTVGARVKAAAAKVTGAAKRKPAAKGKVGTRVKAAATKATAAVKKATTGRTTKKTTGAKTTGRVKAAAKKVASTVRKAASPRAKSAKTTRAPRTKS